MWKSCTIRLVVNLVSFEIEHSKYHTSVNFMSGKLRFWDEMHISGVFDQSKAQIPVFFFGISIFELNLTDSTPINILSSYEVKNVLSTWFAILEIYFCTQISAPNLIIDWDVLLWNLKKQISHYEYYEVIYRLSFYLNRTDFNDISKSFSNSRKRQYHHVSFFSLLKLPAAL